MLNEQQERWCAESRWDFSDLTALFLNCTLKRSPERAEENKPVSEMPTRTGTVKASETV